MEFAAGPRREPICLQLAGFPGTQVAHRAVEFSFHIKRSDPIGTIAHRCHTVSVESQLRAIRPKNNGCLSRISFLLFVLKALDHGIATAAIDNCEPSIGGIYPE